MKFVVRKLLPYLVSLALLAGVLYLSDITELTQQFGNISMLSLVIIMAVLLVNLLLVSLRLSCMLSSFGLPVPYAQAFRANMAGYLGGLLMWSLLGQTLGRQSMLAKTGVKPSVVAMLTAYERIIIAGISLLFALLGSLYLYNWDVIHRFIGNLPVMDLVMVLTVSLTLYFLIGRTRFEQQILDTFQLRKLLAFIGGIGGLSALSQCLMLFAFTIAIVSFATNVTVIQALCASAIISFAATLPVSINGWGVREAAAVYVLTYFNMPMEQALAISILVGLCSSIAILMTAPYVLKQDVNMVKESPVTTDAKNSVLNLEKTAVWLLGVAVASLVFFQVHLELPQIDGLINVNLADPFALFAFAIVVQDMFQHRALPQWRLRYFNSALVMLTSLLLFGFFYALPSIGVTSWGLGSRLLGWVIILGYLSVGYLVMTHLGQKGLRRFTQNMVFVAMSVVLVQLLARLLDYYGFESGFLITKRFEGYAANRNAFSFQLLVMLIVIIAYSHNSYFKLCDRAQKNKKKHISIMMMSIILLGLLFAESRAGLGTALIIMFYSMMSGKACRTIMVKSIFISLCAYICLIYLPPLVKALASDSKPILSFIFNSDKNSLSSIINMETESTRSTSDSERWVSIIRGIEMWWGQPIFGAGLGAFIDGSKEWANKPLVIHSTPVWLLAEFGIVGAILVMGIFYKVFSFAWRWKTGIATRQLLLLLLIGFAIFSTVHEIFYQRIFWLLIGALIAIPMAMIKLSPLSTRENSVHVPVSDKSLDT